jgi:pimeloyl-ACP methyl ester carboxylesterase
VVVLVHGLWTNRYVLFPWVWQFRRRGVHALAFGYPSRGTIAENTRRLNAFIASLTATNVYLLGHSLGGVMVLNLLADAAVSGPGMPPIPRAVLAGSPVAGSGSGAARRMARWPMGRWMAGGAFAALENQPVFRAGTNLPATKIGVIAGTRPIGLGRLLGALPKPNDGAVTVAETRLGWAADAITMPLGHSEMLLSDRLIGQACTFFATGRFDHHAGS